MKRSGGVFFLAEGGGAICGLGVEEFCGFLVVAGNGGGLVVELEKVWRWS